CNGSFIVSLHSHNFKKVSCTKFSTTKSSSIHRLPAQKISLLYWAYIFSKAVGSLFFNNSKFLSGIMGVIFNYTPVFLINNSLLLLRPCFILQLGSRDQSFRLIEVNLRFMTKRSNYEPILMVN